MLKFGLISGYDPATGLSRVHFDEDDIVSGWLPRIVDKTLTESDSEPTDVNEHVACLMDENCEHGVILGAINSKNETPALQSADIFGRKYSSGDEISYDRKARKSKQLVGTTEFDLEVAGPSLTKGGESLKKILSDLLTQILAETHPTPVGPTGPPLNTAAFTAIQTRINAFFKN